MGAAHGSSLAASAAVLAPPLAGDAGRSWHAPARRTPSSPSGPSQQPRWQPASVALAAFGGGACARHSSRRCRCSVVARRAADGGDGGTVSEDAGASRSKPQKVGVVLLNIGTPQSLELDEVERYLGNFLQNPKVMAIKDPEEKRVVFQKMLGPQVSRSVESYKRIWDPVRGSPLLYHSQDLVSALQEELGPAFNVCIGFQYSEPSVDTAVAKLTAQGLERIVMVPMFPHFAEATVASFLVNATEIASELGCGAYLQVLPPFYRAPCFVSAVGERVREAAGVACADVDHVLFSFHGIPKQLPPPEDPRNSYRIQCLETAGLIARSLGLPDGRWSLAFQSRASLRKAIDWITPYTDELLRQLPSEGKRRVAVCSPSYTADCIETLGEVALDGRDIFLSAGGSELVSVPALNSSAGWARGLAAMIRELPETAAAAQEAAAASGQRGFWAM